DQACQERLPRLEVFRGDPIVANHGVGHHHDLTRVRRVAEDLLVARHRRVENDFAFGVRKGAEAMAGERTTVVEDEESGGHEWRSRGSLRGAATRFNRARGDRPRDPSAPSSGPAWRAT